MRASSILLALGLALSVGLAAPVPSAHAIDMAPAVPVAPAKDDTSFIDVTSATGATTVKVTGKLMSKNKPVGGQKVLVKVDGAKVGEATTGADGAFTAEVPTPTAPGSHELVVEFEGKDQWKPTTAKGTLTVQAGTGITLTATGPQVPAGGLVGLNGKLVSTPGNTPLPGIRVRISGGGVDTWAFTNEAGEYTASLTAPAQPGSAVYTASVDKEGQVQAASTTATVTITPAPSTPTPTASATPTPSPTTTARPSVTPTISSPSATPPLDPPSLKGLWPILAIGAVGVLALLALGAHALHRHRQADAIPDDGSLADITDGELSDDR